MRQHPVTETLPLKLIEVVLVLVAGVVFVWWQLRDVKRAQQQKKPEPKSTQDGTDPPGTPPP